VTGNKRVRIRNIFLIFFIKLSFVVGQIRRCSEAATPSVLAARCAEGVRERGRAWHACLYRSLGFQRASA
jgi:hypothetical protein